MWKCLRCGKEIKLVVEAEKTYKLGEKYEDEQEQVDENTNFEYYVCDCTKEETDNIELEDIAEWED